MVDLDAAIESLSRTPVIVHAMLGSLDERWGDISANPESWSPRQILEHLIHGERTDWMPRTRHILAGNPAPFEPFDRTGGRCHDGERPSLAMLLTTFADLRRTNLAALMALNLSDEDVQRCGVHPELGTVRLGELLACWVVHDLDHLAQIVQEIAQPYAPAIGPWRAYLPIAQRGG